MSGESPTGTGVPADDPADLGDLGEVIRFDVVDQGAGAVAVHVVGEVDTLTAPMLHARLEQHVDTAPLLVLDLSEVTFLGSAGLAVLVATKDARESRGHRLSLVCGTRIVTRALEATGLLGLFDVADDVEQAVARGRGAAG